MLHAPLLDRSGRAIVLTDAGVAYLGYARRALQDLEAGRRAIHDVQELSRGALRVAMTPTFTACLVGRLVKIVRRGRLATLLGAGSAAMTMRPSPASPIAPSNVLRIAVMGNLLHGSRNFGDQVTVSVVVSIELRMKPPGFQIGVSSWASPLVLVQRIFSVSVPEAGAVTCACQRRKLYFPGSGPSVVARQVMPPSVERSTRATPQSPPKAIPRTGTGAQDRPFAGW